MTTVLTRSLPLALIVLAAWIAPASATTTDDVPTYNGSYGGDRYSTLSQITRENAGALHAVCALQLGAVGPMQSGLIVEHGVIYLTQDNSTFAVDARTCKKLWQNDYKNAGKRTGIANRGVAFLDGTLYRGTMDSHLIAIDAASGKTLWDVRVTDSSDGSNVAGAPIAWNGKVFLGLTGAEFGVRGKIMAFSAADGRPLWTFDTVPLGNEAGAKTWPKADTAIHGGGSWWTSATLDESAGTVFFPVGNPAPDYLSDYRPGDNLYTDSIVALDTQTGKLRWYYQLVPHDYHDWDTTVPPALFTAANGRRMLAFAGKDGYLFTMDAATHRVVERVPVTTIENVDRPFTPEGVHFCPNMGVQWNGPAYSPAEHLTFINSVDWCSTIKRGPVHYEPGKFFLGSANGSGIRDAQRTGWLSAVDPLTGRFAWRYHAKSPMVGGITVTAGGVLFTGEYTGEFDAFDAATGRVLYQFQTGGPVAGGVVTYTAGGKQYVAVASGNHSVASLGGSGSPTLFIFSL